jgi:glutamate carboxypeptidase
MTSAISDIRKWLQPREAEMIETLRRLVEAESPSFNKAAADRCGELIADEWRKRGADVTPIAQPERGNHLRIEIPFEGARPKGQVLLLGHFDTVHDLGALARMPWRVEEGRAYGPGTFDMKAGIVQALFAVDALRALGVKPAKGIAALWTTDEEIGSDTSREHIEREAKRSDAVLVLEPSAGPKGTLKTGRKGVGEAEIIVTGRASHAGLNPQAGVNAVHELALQIERLMKLTDYKRGTTVNVDIIEGGTRANVIAERARAVVDLRASTMANARALTKKLHALKPILNGATIEVHGGINRPPMERKYAVALFRQAQKLGREIGIELDEAFVGGGSDGNLTAALGIPTLDGLGAIGDGAHSQHEHVVTRSLPERAALVAGLLLTV